MVDVSKMINPAPHPLTMLPAGTTGVGGLMSGDRIIYTIDHRHGWADEFLPDGETLVTFDDGEHTTVNWRWLITEAGISG